METTSRSEFLAAIETANKQHGMGLNPDGSVTWYAEFSIEVSSGPNGLAE